MHAPGPPRAAEWLIALSFRRVHERDMVLGDLHEEYVGHSMRQGADRWYWRQAISIAAHALARRIPADSTPHRSGDFFMRIFLKDVKYAWRSLLKRPLLTVTVATTRASRRHRVQEMTATTAMAIRRKRSPRITATTVAVETTARAEATSALI